MWTNLGLNIPNGDVIKIQTTISVLSCLYASGSNLIVGMKGYNNSATLPGGGIYHFINNGSNWVLADTALMLRQVVAITAYGINIYAATSDSGVFRSTDNGATWTNINSGLKDLGTGSITISNSYMYATTPSGVWKRPLSEISAVDDNLSGIRIPAECNLSQNYPNPFNPSTIISYQIPTTRFVTLKVYDILGREVKTLVNEQKNAGSYKVSFDGSKLASGVYIYQLCAGGFIKTRKLLLIK
jgi:hypothetical protein